MSYHYTGVVPMYRALNHLVVGRPILKMNFNFIQQKFPTFISGEVNAYSISSGGQTPAG